MEITVGEKQICSARINGENYEGVKSFSPPTEKDPYWKIIFDRGIIFATGTVTIDLGDLVEIKVERSEKRNDLRDPGEISGKRKLRIDP